MKLSKKERAFCEIMMEGYMARNPSGLLCVYEHMPVRNTVRLTWERSDFYSEKTTINDHYFKLVRWEDEPYSIEKMLEWEVE